MATRTDDNAVTPDGIRVAHVASWIGDRGGSLHVREEREEADGGRGARRRSDASSRSRPEGGRGRARPPPHLLRARPRPHPPQPAVPPPGRQVPGLHRPRRRPPAHPAHPRHRGRPGGDVASPGRWASTWRSPPPPPPATTAATGRPATPREEALSPFVPGGYHHAVYGADVVLAPLNLCAETLDAVRNHSWNRPAPATPEGEVVAWADRIAYVLPRLRGRRVAPASWSPATCPTRCVTWWGPTGARQLAPFITPMVRHHRRHRDGRRCARPRPTRSTRSGRSTTSASTCAPSRAEQAGRVDRAAAVADVVVRRPSRRDGQRSPAHPGPTRRWPRPCATSAG